MFGVFQTILVFKVGIMLTESNRLIYKTVEQNFMLNCNVHITQEPVVWLKDTVTYGSVLQGDVCDRVMASAQ